MTISRCTSSAKITFYTKGDALQFASGTTVNARKDDPLKLVACEAGNSLSAGGTFRATFKFSNDSNPLFLIEDDTWVDISFAQNGIYTHCFRGIVDDIRISEDASRGPTVRLATVSGRSFQKAYESTSIFFLPTLGESQLISLTQQEGGVGNGIPQIIGSPSANVKLVLFDLFSYMGSLPGSARSNWSLPPTLPLASFLVGGNDVAGTTKLNDAVVLDTTLIDAQRTGQDTLKKQNKGNSTTFQNDVNLWQLAKQFADEPFCELFTDLVPTETLDNLGTVSETQTRMTIVMRDRPCLLVSDDTGRPTRRAGNYFNLPVYTVRRQDVAAMTYGCTGLERFNSFSVAVMGDIQISDSPLRQPVWNTENMALHGLRRMDVQSMYFSEEGNLGGYLRAQLRDYYCRNASHFSGSASLAYANLQMRVGCVVRFPNFFGGINPMEAYIESVNHSWRYNALRTDFTFTRGFRGTPEEELASMDGETQQYRVAGT